MLTEKETKTFKALMDRLTNTCYTTEQLENKLKNIYKSTDFYEKLVLPKLYYNLELTGENVSEEKAIEQIKNLIKHADLHIDSENPLSELTPDELQECLEEFVHLDYASLSEKDIERDGYLDACMRVQLSNDDLVYRIRYYDEWDALFQSHDARGFEISEIWHNTVNGYALKVPKFTAVTYENIIKIHQIYKDYVREARKVYDEHIVDIQKKIKREQLALQQMQSTIGPSLKKLLGPSTFIMLWADSQIKIDFDNGMFMYKLPQGDDFHFDLLLDAITQICFDETYRINCYYGFGNATFELMYENGHIKNQDGDCYV